VSDLELAQIKLDAATHNERRAFFVATRAESEWRDAVALGSVSSSLASHRYATAERALEQAREQLEQARAAVRSASIESECA
jgi:hypothetical protein